MQGSHIRNTEIFLNREPKRLEMLDTSFDSFIKDYKDEWAQLMDEAIIASQSGNQNTARFGFDQIDRLNARKVEHQWFDLPVDCALVAPTIPANFSVMLTGQVVINIPELKDEDVNGFNQFLLAMNENEHISNKMNFRLADTVVTRKTELFSREEVDSLGRKLPAELDRDGNPEVIDTIYEPVTLDLTSTMRLNTDPGSPYFGKLIVDLSYMGPIPTYSEVTEEKLFNVVTDPNLEGIQERKISDLFRNLGIKTSEEVCFENCIPKNYTTVYSLAPEFRNKVGKFNTSYDTPHIFRIQWQSLKGINNLFSYYKKQNPLSYVSTPLNKTETRTLTQDSINEPVDFVKYDGISKQDVNKDSVTWAFRGKGGEYDHLEYVTYITAVKRPSGIFTFEDFTVDPQPINSDIPNRLRFDFELDQDSEYVYLRVKTGSERVITFVSTEEVDFNSKESINVTESTLEASIFNLNGHPLDVAQQGVIEFENEITRKVKFNNSFTDQNYSISMTPSGNVTPRWGTKGRDGFDIVCNVPFTGSIDWVASKHPDPVPPPTDYQFTARDLGQDPDELIENNKRFKFSNNEILKTRIDQKEPNLLELLKSKRVDIKS